MLRRERPADWPTPAGLLNWVDEGEANRVMTYALSGQDFKHIVAFLERDAHDQGRPLMEDRALVVFSGLTALCARSGNRLTWNVAVPWPAEALEQLGSRRYVSEAGDDHTAKPDPQAKLDRCACARASAPCLISSAMTRRASC